MVNDPYTVELTDSARRDMAAAPSMKARVIRQLLTLEVNPERGHPLTKRLGTCRSLVISDAGGGYRAVYIIYVERKTCLVFAMGPHETAYELAEKRFPPRMDG